MNITDDKKAFGEACLDTCFGSICVKKRGKKLPELFDDPQGHGILVRPVIQQGPSAMSEFKVVMNSFHPVVIVRGHGWAGEELFVWTGTSDEFNQTWEID